MEELSADVPYIRDGAVTLFWRVALFEAAKADLASASYELVHVRCETAKNFIEDMSRGLNWEAQFDYAPWSGNLNALEEGVAGVAFSASQRLALCFRGFQDLAAEDAGFARGVLDVIEYQSRDHLVHGRRLVALVQTDDATFEARNLGTRAANWTVAERFYRGRV